MLLDKHLLTVSGVRDGFVPTTNFLLNAYKKKKLHKHE